jgi:hypothetical protein
LPHCTPVGERKAGKLEFVAALEIDKPKFVGQDWLRPFG